MDALRKAERDRAPKKNTPNDIYQESVDWTAPPEKSRNLPIPLILFGITFLIVLFFVVQSRMTNTASNIAVIEDSPVSETLVLSSIQDPTSTPVSNSDPAQVSVSASPPPESIVLLDNQQNALSSPEPLQANDLQSRIDNLVFEGSLFSPSDSALSRIFIAGNSYRIGDAVEDSLYILDIQESIVVFSDGIEQIEHPIR